MIRHLRAWNVRNVLHRLTMRPDPYVEFPGA